MGETLNPHGDECCTSEAQKPSVVENYAGEALILSAVECCVGENPSVVECCAGEA